MNIQDFTDEAPFAKVVTTKDGDALMIGHFVFQVTGPEVFGGSAANALAIALRRHSGMPAVIEKQDQDDSGAAAFQRGVSAGRAVVRGQA